MRAKIRFFHTLRDLIGAETLDFEVSGNEKLGDIRTRLSERYPQAAATLATAMIAQNKEFAQPDDIVKPDAEIAFMPPVSGG